MMIVAAVIYACLWQLAAANHVVYHSYDVKASSRELEDTTAQITDRCFEECIEQQMPPEQCKSYILEQIQTHEITGLEVEIVQLRNVTHTGHGSSTVLNMIKIQTNLNGQVACDLADGWVAWRFDWLRKSHPDEAVRIAADCGGDNVDACCEDLHNFAGRNTDEECLYCAPQQQVLTPVVYPPGTGELGFEDTVFNVKTGECDVIYYTEAEVEEIDKQTRLDLFLLAQYWREVIDQGSISCEDLQLFQNKMLFYARAVFQAHQYLGALTCQFCEDGEFVGSWEVLLSSIAEAFFLIEFTGIDSAVAKVTIYVSVDGTTVISTPAIAGRYEVDCEDEPDSNPDGTPPDGPTDGGETPDQDGGETPDPDGGETPDGGEPSKTCALPDAASKPGAMDVSTLRDTCISAAEDQGVSNVPKSNTCNMAAPPPSRGVGTVITLANGPLYDSATCTTTLEYKIKSFTGAAPRRALREEVQEQDNKVVDVVAQPQDNDAAAVEDSFFGRLLRVFNHFGGGGGSAAMGAGRGAGGGPSRFGISGSSSSTPPPPTAAVASSGVPPMMAQSIPNAVVAAEATQEMGHAVIGWMGSCVLDSYTIVTQGSVVSDTTANDAMFLQQVDSDTCTAGVRVTGDIIPKHSSVTIRMVFDGFTGVTDAAASAESATLKWGNACVPIKLSVADCRPGAGPLDSATAAEAADKKLPALAADEALPGTAAHEHEVPPDIAADEGTGFDFAGFETPGGVIPPTSKPPVNEPTVPVILDSNAGPAETESAGSGSGPSVTGKGNVGGFGGRGGVGTGGRFKGRPGT
jgi:hypothetical protein